MSKFQFPTFSSMHYKRENQEHRISSLKPPEKQILYSYSAVILKAGVILWPVRCSLHPGCGGGSGGGRPAADVMSAGTSGS